MTYRLAKSLDLLRDEINRAAPRRSKASDGWIGDAAHATRGSDHNPWVIDSGGVGVVRAFDFTHDPQGGVDCHVLAERLRLLGRSGDVRLRDGGYVIWNRRIASGAAENWGWRPYSGSNPHTRHVHISVSRKQSGYDDTRAWSVALANIDPPPAPTPRSTFMSELTEVEQRELLNRVRNLPSAVWQQTIVDGRVGMNAPVQLVIGEVFGNTRKAVASSAIAAAAASNGVSEQEIVRGVLEALSPEAIAAAIPADLADRVIDALGTRIKGGAA